MVMKQKLKNCFKRSLFMNLGLLVGQIFVFFVSEKYNPIPAIVLFIIFNTIHTAIYLFYYRGNRIDKLIALRYLNKMIKTEEHGQTMKDIMLINHDAENNAELEKKSNFQTKKKIL